MAHKIGSKVICTHAATSWFKVGQIYEVVAHPETDAPSVIAKDGLYDMLSLCVSKFASRKEQLDVKP